MSPNATTIEQEGVYIDNFKLLERGRFREKSLSAPQGAKYPARNPLQNVNDIKAQIAANEMGVRELRKMVRYFTLPVARAYMRHVQDNAAESVRRVIDRLHETAPLPSSRSGHRPSKCALRSTRRSAKLRSISPAPVRSRRRISTRPSR